MAVSPSDIAQELGQSAVTDAQVIQWGQWITDALLLIRVGDGTHVGLGDPSALDPAVVDYVVRQAVVAHARRPDDATQVDVSVDDGRTSRMYQSGKGRVAILDEWWDMLAPAATPDEAFTIRPSYTPDRSLSRPGGWSGW